MISKEDIHHLAELARINLTAPEEERLCADLDAILAYVHELASVATITKTEELHHSGMVRDDTTRDVSPLTADKARSTFPASRDNYCTTPRVLGESAPPL